MISLGLFAVSGRHQFTVGSWVVLLQFLGNNEGWKYVRFMADKCDTKAAPQSGLQSYYCYGKDLQGEGGKREVSYTASFLCLPVQFLIWWGVNMCFWGGFVKHFSYLRIFKFKPNSVLFFNPVVIQNGCKTLPKQKYRIYLLVLPSCERQGMIMNLEIIMG